MSQVVPSAPIERARRSLSTPSLRRRFALALAAALLLHVPATPFALIVKALSTLFHLESGERHDYDAGATTISVELADQPPAPQPRADRDKVESMTVEPPPGRLSEPSPQGVKLPKGEERPDDPEGKRAEAEAQKAKKPRETKRPEELGLAGELGKGVQGKPNVTMTIWFSSMREHPMSGVLEPLLACTPLGGALARAGIDPLRDLEGAVVSGPKLHDPSKLTLAVHHRMKPEALRAAVDKLVRRVEQPGAWIDETAARIHAGRARRVVFPHARDLVFAMPEQGWEQVRAIRAPLSIPAARGRALSIALLEPAIPLKRIGLRLPESLREMRLDIYLSVSGAGEVRVSFEDKDPASAREHATEVGLEVRDFVAQVRAVGSLAGALGPIAGAPGELARTALPDLGFVADEERIVAEAELSAEQMAAVTARLQGMMCVRPKAAGSAPAPPGSYPPPGQGADAGSGTREADQ
jgi:hypothetical protein